MRALFILAVVVVALAAKPKTLIVTPKADDVQLLKKSLESKYDVTVSTQEPTNLQYKKFGEAEYNNIILFGVNGDIEAKKFLDFVDSNNNAIIVSKPEQADGEALPEGIRDAAIECGVLFSDKNVVDTKHNNGNKEEIKTNNFVSSKPIFGGRTPKELVYKGLALQVEKNNPLLIPFVTAEQTAYAPADSSDDEDSAAATEPFVLGTNAVLAAGLQTRQGSRMAFIGSTLLFNGKHQSNTEFVDSIVEWAFGERGHLRYSNVEFDKVSGEHQGIRIRDHLRYSVKIQEQVNGKWVPFKADDIQLEFTMIDPYIRQSLKYDEKKNDGTYSIEFQAPDVYGIFKFVVDYRRAGYTLLYISNQVTVRPLRLNEYDRFIGSAYPYYAGVLSCYAAFFIFILLVLNSGN